MEEELDTRGKVQPFSDSARLAWTERSVVVILFLALFIGVLLILRPFAAAILFGATLANATWPLRQALVARGMGRGLTATLLLLLSVAAVVLPIVLIAPHLAENLRNAMGRLQIYLAAMPPAPAWVPALPLVGKRVASAWSRIGEVQGNLQALSEVYALKIEALISSAAQSLIDSIVQLVLSLVVATMFWVNGEEIVRILHVSLRRLGGPTADHMVDVAGGAIRGVAYGVMGTAALQAVLIGIGLAVAGVPGAVMLSFVSLLLAISQIGAPFLIVIWGGASWWLFRQDHEMWAVFMIVWGLFVSVVDNVVKPWLIGRGIGMPLSLTILGVFGGFIAFGFLGLFVGPTLIAVLFGLLEAWHSMIRASGEVDHRPESLRPEA